MKEELILSSEILQKATKRGNEYGWKLSDIPQVLLDAKNKKLANLGGQLQFRFPNATYELYWLDIDSGVKGERESWEAWVIRSYETCLQSFEALIKKVDFVKEAENSFPQIKEKVQTGINIRDFAVFILYFEDEK